MIFAVDPGSAAGAAILFERAEFGPPRIRGAFAWRKGPSRRPGLEVRGAFVASEAGVQRVNRLIRQSRIETGHQLGLVLEVALRGSGVAGVRLVVEDVFLGKNAATVIALARWAGAFAGALEPVSASVEYVRADEWRAQALGIRHGTPREVAKERTAAALPAGLRDQLAGFGEVLGGVEHLLDAAGIGLWASGLRVEPPPAKKRGGRSG